MLGLKVIHVSKRGPRWWFNALRLRQNGRHFMEGVFFKFIILYESCCNSIQCSQQFISKCSINKYNTPALVQIMALQRRQVIIWPNLATDCRIWLISRWDREVPHYEAVAKTTTLSEWNKITWKLVLSRSRITWRGWGHSAAPRGSVQTSFWRPRQWRSWMGTH